MSPAVPRWLVEDLVEIGIAYLDALDGDPDREPDADKEPNCDAEPEGAALYLSEVAA